MNLTKSHKQAFVRAVMNDVPKVDYAKQLQDKIMAILVRTLPQEIQEVCKNKKLVDHLMYSYVNCFGTSFSMRGLTQNITEGKLERITTADEWSELCAINRLYDDQIRTIKELERDLTGSVEGVRTLKQLQNLFPEMVKYMPSQIERTNNLPATNVVSALVQAGWPKDGNNKT